ncbi:hypothetical protein ALP37_200187 [Pseudomonas amygdali pv. sesami]|nr:hypothetical protein ALO93_02220 [Pseudomonas amygdali pv. sesami]RMU04652.1 hypothetical protein ALP37_200187 [Pseudomonas amygdali pv. sesami]
MEGYEHPTRDASPHEIFRLSWLAYVGPIFTFLVLIAVSSGTSWLTIHKAQTDQAHQIGITISVLVLLLSPPL